MRSVRGRVIVITGASAGIGRVTAERLAAHGATVVACARHEGRLATLAERASKLDGAVDVRRCDVTSPGDRVALVDGVLARHGRVDALVNNAGIGWEGLVEDMEAADVERVFATNVVALVDLTRLVLPGMLERRSGDVVMVSSGAAWVSLPPTTVYSSSKYAVDGFVEGLRREVWARKVRVHSVNPGPVRTEWLARSRGYEPGERSVEERLSAGVPPRWVAAAIERSLNRPWPRTAAVPRLVGLTRLLAVQPARGALDVISGLSAASLSATARRRAAEGTPGAQRSRSETLRG